jgi:hypothetical protein
MLEDSNDEQQRLHAMLLGFDYRVLTAWRYFIARPSA